MATKDTVVQELVVNTLTHKQFKAAQEAGTLSPYELYGTPDTSVRLPVLTPMWFDHIANDVSWLRADTFSWQSGDVYVAAYEHLASDFENKQGKTAYKWYYSDEYYTFVTFSPTPKVGDFAYAIENNNVVAINKITEVGADYIKMEGSESTSFYYLGLQEEHPIIETAYNESVGAYANVLYYVAEDGHKICLPNQENNVSEMYETTGIAWYYILDTDNKQFKLPRSKHNKYADTVPVVGNGMTLGLTNGTTEFGMAKGGTYTNMYTNVPGTPVGTAGTATISNTNSIGVTPDPEKSGIVAQQTQDTDQYKYLYFYVGNFEQDSVEQTAGINAEMFNGKADVNLMNTTSNVDFVVESQLPTADNGYTWYRKYKSGWVMQGGRTSVANDTGVNITLPVAMMDTNYYANWISCYGVSNNGQGTRSAEINSTTEIRLYNGQDVTMLANWFTCGYAA